MKVNTRSRSLCRRQFHEHHSIHSIKYELGCSVQLCSYPLWKMQKRQTSRWRHMESQVRFVRDGGHFDKTCTMRLTLFPLLTGNWTFSHFPSTMRPSLHSLKKHWPLVLLGRAHDHRTAVCQLNGNKWKCSHVVTQPMRLSLTVICLSALFRRQHLADATVNVVTRLTTNGNQVAYRLCWTNTSS